MDIVNKSANLVVKSEEGKPPVLKPTSEALAGKKYIALYFSAHWCPPCRQFTPMLCKFYTELKAKRDDFEFIFVSSDRDQKSFDDYHSSMPFLALPFEERGLKAELSELCGVRGIPSFVTADASGLLNKQARGCVQTDAAGADFPWKQCEQSEYFDGLVQCGGGSDGALNKSSLSKLEAVGLYFSAHWCGPCRKFTPKLAELYKKVNAGKKRLEIIFVSRDTDEASFKNYTNEMPWVTIPYGDPRLSQAKMPFSIDGIPSLQMFKGDLITLINSDADAVVRRDNDGSLFPWGPQPLPDVVNLGEELFQEAVEAINTKTGVVLDLSCVAEADAPKFVEAFKQTKPSAPTAQLYYTEPKPDDDEPPSESAELLGRILKAARRNDPSQGVVKDKDGVAKVIRFALQEAKVVTVEAADSSAVGDAVKAALA